jgi:aryl-alcohol dehydrogenase-like predicted oxidoreductase
MRQLVLPGTGVCVSRLSFGTGSLHHVPTSRARQNLLAAAYESGFTHFDTAPSYGFGVAERELGRFISGRPGRISVATKIGLYPPRGARSSSTSVWARKIAGRLFPARSRAVVDWSLAAAIRSLDESLRRLKTGQIDLLLLHEPVYDALDSDVFLTWFENEHAKGRIRAWGLAGPVDCMGSLLSNSALGMVLQIHDSAEHREADLVTMQGRELQITYGYLSCSHAGCAARDVAAPLTTALHRNVTGSVLVSTRRPDRVRQLADIAERSELGSHSAPDDCKWQA